MYHRISEGRSRSFEMLHRVSTVRLRDIQSGAFFGGRAKRQDLSDEIASGKWSSGPKYESILYKLQHKCGVPLDRAREEDSKIEALRK
jgi:hypothetical protein